MTRDSTTPHRYAREPFQGEGELDIFTTGMIIDDTEPRTQNIVSCVRRLFWTELIAR